MFSAKFDKRHEHENVIDEIEILIYLKFNQNLAQPDLNIINMGFQLEEQIQRQELNVSG